MIGSIYNLMNGVNPATFYFLPMLGKHPDSYPRFRDCFVGEDKKILILTRLGHEDYEEEQEEMRALPNYLNDYVMEDEPTYRMFVYKCPSEWESDWDCLIKGKKPSSTYIDRMCEVYPKLEEKFRKMYEEVSPTQM